ncbi:unnamed protein product, partial [Vitis vinifera]
MDDGCLSYCRSRCSIFNDKCKELAEQHDLARKRLSLQFYSTAMEGVQLGGKIGSWLWCRTNDTVYDAAKHMAENNIGSLVVLKPGEPKHIAGIFTERDYMRKIIAHGRSSKDTKVGEIMTDENKLVTVSSDTNILQAMQLLTGKLLQ